MSSKVIGITAPLCLKANIMETCFTYELLHQRNHILYQKVGWCQDKTLPTQKAWKRALVMPAKWFRWVHSKKEEGQEIHQRDLGFFSKQGRKILRSILGSSIEEDPRKGAKRRLDQEDPFSAGFPPTSLPASLPCQSPATEREEKAKHKLFLNFS